MTAGDIIRHADYPQWGRGYVIRARKTSLDVFFQWGGKRRIGASEPIEGRTSFKGKIERVTPTGVTLADARGHEHQIEFRQIVAANVVQAPKRTSRRPETGGQL